MFVIFSALNLQNYQNLAILPKVPPPRSQNPTQSLKVPPLKHPQEPPPRMTLIAVCDRFNYKFVAKV